MDEIFRINCEIGNIKTVIKSNRGGMEQVTLPSVLMDQSLITITPIPAQ